MSLARLTVITPCLNAESTIRDTLESLFAQSIPIQSIVIDGGSSDGTLSILEEYRDEIDILISEQDRGISEAFNKGLALANGDYIAILNADDFYEPDICLQVVSFAQENQNPEIVHGSVRYLESNGSTYVEKPDTSNIWKYMSVFHPTMFVHQRVYKQIGYFDLDYHYAMDSEWVHRAVSRGIEFVAYPGVISTMRLGGKSHRNSTRSLAEFRRSVIVHKRKYLMATYYFARQSIVQGLLKWPWVKQLVLLRRRLN